MAEQNLLQSQTLRQEQILSANQIQSLDILMSTMMELQAKVEQELAVNPVLEQEKKDSDDSADAVNKNKDSLLEQGDEKAENLKDDDYDNFNQLTESWHDYLPSINTAQNYYVDEEKHSHFFNSLIDTPSMEKDLTDQISFLNLDNYMNNLCTLIIGSLDDQGYFKGSLADLAVIGGSDLNDMEKALKIIQKLDPPGIGAKDLKESLLLQLERSNKSNKDILIEIIRNHLDEIASNQLPLVAKKLNIDLDELNNYLQLLKKFNPSPYFGRSSNNDSIFILPEISIIKEDGEYKVILDKEYQPRLRISDHYLNILSDKNTPKETRDYIKNKVLSGNHIIKSIEQRQETIKKIVEVIIDTQYEFLEHGVEHLIPLTMKDVADKIGVHETTVSRAVSNKYIRTPQGIFELRYFFSAGFQSSDGEMISSKGVMEKIRDIVEGENKRKPLSDDAIKKILNDEGIPVARRTVAKYREEISIPSSRLRKKFN
ncbi:MAG TPA: RNA polymerase factor sigma-54 [Victivallales bacterium]|nr:RNA polymerase factor sigma-54 [Victivallales bacterium]